MTKRIDISFNRLAEGNMSCVGLGNFRCLGKIGEPYPADLTIDPATPGTKENPHYSGTYGCFPNNDARGRCIMNYAILIWGQNGVYIHEWPGVPTYAGNGNQTTHGCIHLAVGEAKKVFDWVDARTRIIISRPW